MTEKLKSFLEQNVELMDSDLKQFLAKGLYVLYPADFEELISILTKLNVNFEDARLQLIKNKLGFIFPVVTDGTPLIDVIHDHILDERRTTTFFGLNVLELFRFIQAHEDEWKDDMHLEVNRYSNVIVRTNYAN